MTTPAEPVPLDRFGNALVGDLLASPAYRDTIPGLPVRLGSDSSTPPGDNAAIKSARSALMGNTLGSSATTERLHDAGATIILLAQCARETGVCQEYLQYTTLPNDNNSGLFAVDEGGGWAGSGSRFNGNIKDIYDAAVSSLPYTQPMFSDEDLEQFNDNPIIVFRLGYFIKAFMDACYPKPEDKRRVRLYGEYS
tara:strand:- start:547 stop:1131 length:585 start_codon:yes stop_codon:yes gene_type:complete